MNYKLNGDKTVAVATSTTGQHWLPIDADTPRGVKLQLLGKGGVAQYGLWDGKEPFFTHWAPVPRRAPE